MNTKSALWIVVSTLVAGCGGAATECERVPCTATASYQICASSNTLTYNYGPQTCSCDKDVQSAQCQACLSSVTDYCAQLDGTAGGGGSGGGGAGGGGTAGGGGSVNVSCSASFVGGLDGTFSACNVQVTQTSATTWTISGQGGELPGTSNDWNGFTMTNLGTAAGGEYDQSSSTSTTTSLFAGTAHWSAGFGQGTTTGDFNVRLDSLGIGTTVTGVGIVYAEPHGIVTGTLVDSTGANAEVFLTVSF